jgi:rhomboid protease GluP
MLAAPLDEGTAQPQGSDMTQHDAAPTHGNGSEQEAVTAPAHAVAAASFEVEFGLRVGLNTTPADSFRFVGKGSIAFAGDAVTIAGGRKRPFMTSLKERHRFARNDIINASLSGKTVRFQVRGENQPARTVQLSAASVPQSLSIMAHLPAEQTQEFAQSQAAVADFHRRLDQFSPRAPITPILVALNVAMFLAMCIGGMNIITPDGETAVRWGSNFGPMTIGGQWWRLFSATFIHFGIIHLALNMWALFQNGRTIERLFGSTRFLLLYVFAGLTGSIASLLWNPLVNSAGASGAIFGIFGGLLAFVINPRNDVPKEVMSEHRNSTLLFAGYSLFYGFAHSGIDNAAHIGGLAGGFLMGLLLSRPLNAEHRIKPNLPRLLLATVSGAVVLAAMLWPLANSTSQRQATARFEGSMMTFSAREKAAMEATKVLYEKARSGSMSEQAFAEGLEKNVSPQWDAIYADVEAIKLSPDNGDYSFQQAVLHYVDARRQEIHAYAHATAEGGPAAEQAVKKANQNTQAALAELNRLVAARK